MKRRGAHAKPRWPGVLILLLLVQSLAPTGYMPASLATGWPVMLCPDGLPPGFLTALARASLETLERSTAQRPASPGDAAHHLHHTHAVHTTAQHAQHHTAHDGATALAHAGHSGDHGGSHGAQSPYCPLGGATDEPVLDALAAASITVPARTARVRPPRVRLLPLSRNHWPLLARGPPAFSLAAV